MLRHFSFSVILILCAVIGIDTWSHDNFEYARNKRAKYYSIPLNKYYNRPSYSQSYKGPTYSSSYGYTSNDIGLPTSKLRPYKLSKRPINEGLGDEDFGNLIRYLSSKDLDKIVEVAAEKQKYADYYNDVDESDEDFSGNNFWNVDYEKDSPDLYPNPNKQFEYNKHSNIAGYPQTYINSMYSKIPMQEEIEKLSLLDEYIQREINVMSDGNNIFTDSSTMKEEELPKPSNLREDDYDGSFTNNVPSVVNPEFSYRLENFADLPLMGYENSKLEKVNSYSVPHYSVSTSYLHSQIFLAPYL